MLLLSALENSYFGHHCFSAFLKAESHVKRTRQKTCLEAIKKKVFFRLKFLLKMLFPFCQHFSSYFDQQPGFPTGVAMLAIISEYWSSQSWWRSYFLFSLLRTVMCLSLEKAPHQLEAMTGDNTSDDLKHLCFLKMATHSSVNPA